MAENQQARAVRSINNIKTYLDDGTWEQETVVHLKTKISHLKASWDKYVNANAAIVPASDDEKEQNDRDYDAIEADCMALDVRLQTCITELQNRAAAQDAVDIEDDHSEHDNDDIPNGQGNRNDHGNQNDNGNRNELARPIYVNCSSNRHVENTWGEFDGDRLAWQGFHDRFKAAVHDNEQIANVFKFQHLMKSLKGQAKIDLGDWPQTENSYAELWERFNELYKCKYTTSIKLVRKFLDLPKLDRPSAFMLQKLSNTTHEVMRQLRTMGYPVEHYSLFFMAGIHERMDPETARAWNLERASDTPTTNEILSFLDRQARAATVSSDGYRENRKRNSNNRDIKQDAKRPKPSTSNESQSEQKLGKRICLLCKEPHGMHQCETFRKMNLNERRKCVKEHEVCFNCLNPSHNSSQCRASECKRCPGKKHNSLLCQQNPFNRKVNQVQVKQKQKKGKKSDKNSE